ncbi:MAG: hypothetical protein WC489_06155 [Patescibacteria group bacterium]
MKRDFHSFVERKKREYGSKFSQKGLAKKFIPFYENQQRIKVQTPWGETLTGTVGVTTGWEPVFLLMRRKNAVGSSEILTNRHEIVAIKWGNKYVKLRFD